MALLGHVSAQMSLRYGSCSTPPSAPNTNAPSPSPRQRIGPLPGGRTSLPLAVITGNNGWKDSRRDQVPARRRILPARPRPGRLRLRQHLRALPELPHRHRLPASARSTTSRRRASRPRSRLFKTELIKPCGPWRTVEQVEIATLDYVDWFNNRRLYEACGDIPPAELEDAYYRQNTGLAEAS